MPKAAQVSGLVENRGSGSQSRTPLADYKHQTKVGKQRSRTAAEESGMEQPKTMTDVKSLMEELEWRREAVNSLEGTLEMIRKIILSDQDDHTKVDWVRLLIVE